MEINATRSSPIMPSQLPHVNAKIHAIGCEFLFPYFESFGEFVDNVEEADFILAMNNIRPDMVSMLTEARRSNKPLSWWTIEDPNSLTAFLNQASQADFVFTTDEACISQYREHLGHNRIFWLPLACNPDFHRPLDLANAASDFVISANWYRNQARLWSVKTLVDPLLAAGYTLTLYCYQSFMWPAGYQRYWRGETSCRTVAEQYRNGRVVLGLNNQRSGFDGRQITYMTSMRTFEALACRKPFLATQSDAYERLGFIHGEHMAWVDNEIDALNWSNRLLSSEGDHIAKAGRQFVLEQHTYAHRLARIAEITLG